MTHSFSSSIGLIHVEVNPQGLKLLGLPLYTIITSVNNSWTKNVLLCSLHPMVATLLMAVSSVACPYVSVWCDVWVLLTFYMYLLFILYYRIIMFFFMSIRYTELLGHESCLIVTMHFCVCVRLHVIVWYLSWLVSEWNKSSYFLLVTFWQH